jgi:uncharacterized DUF497 family protein
MELVFEWDAWKARENIARHQVSFEEASTVFYDPMHVIYPDAIHSVQEHRFISIGHSKSGKLLMVAHTDRENKIRIISSRKATRHERKTYEEDER